MSKTKITLMSLILALALLIGIGCIPLFTDAAETESKIENSDFYQLGTGVSAVPSEKSTETDVILPYSGEGHLFFGESAEKAYPVDMAVFSWNIRISQLAVGQSFAVSFVKDTTKKPFEGAEGVSFVFTCQNEGTLLSYIVDAADGGLIQEMVDTQSMWAYKKDGSFEEYPKVEGQENYSRGMVGRLITDNVVGASVTLANIVDGASFGGTTNRPVISKGNSLGTTIPGEIFTARDMNIKETILVLSAGGIDGIGDESDAPLKFTVDTPSDKATKQYLSSPARTQIVNRLNDYVFDSEEALAGTLSQADYAALTSGLAETDLSALRVRDRFNQGKVKERIEATLRLLEDKMAYVADSVKVYSKALDALKDLHSVDEQKISGAESARSVYNEYAAYVKYLSGEQLQEVQALVDALDETLLLRGVAHLQIVDFETAVAAFADPVSDTSADLIYAAEQARAGIDFDAISQLKSEDRSAFEKRIAACDEMVEEARLLNAFDVENYKIDLYRSAIGALGASLNVEEFLSVVQSRPVLRLDDVMPSDTEILNTSLRDADALFGKEIVRVLGAWHTAYSEKTYALRELGSLTQAKIDAAKAAAYDTDAMNTLQDIAAKISCDISSSVAQLTECDRTVRAAEVRLLLVRYHELASAPIGDLASLNEAYEAYLLAAESDLGDLSQEERAAYDALFSETNEAYGDAARSLIEPLLKAFETAVAAENIHESAAIAEAKAARAAVPSLDYYIIAADREQAQARFDAADKILLSQTLYYAYATGTSWTLSETDQGLKLSNTLTKDDVCDGLAVIEDLLQIDGFDFAFEFTEIGRIWKGEDPVGSGKNPQSILVMNIMREAGKNKDETQGFSVYFYCNQLDELEVYVYGASNSTGEVMLANGKVSGCGFTADPYDPYTVRIRIEKGTTSYRLYVNSLQLNVYYRDIVNPDEDRASHIPEFEAGSEIGADIFKDGNAYVTFVIFANSLTSDEERQSAITIRMIGDKTFGDYVPPVYTVSVDLVSGPAKTVYEKGETFDKTGIKMIATLSDGTTKEIALDEIKILGFTSTSKGKKNVTLSYTDDTGVTLNKVIQVEIVEAEENGGGSGCGGAVSAASFGAAALMLAACGVILAKKRKKS